MDNRLRFRSFGSGSSGNCYFLGTSTKGILIDAGLSTRAIRRNLKIIGLDFHNIWAVIVTHDHTDHIKSVGNIGEKFNVPIFATQKIHEGIDRNYRITQKLFSSKKFIEIGEEFEIADFKITAFPVSHDATESVGYRIEYKDKVITIATDLGFVGDEAKENLMKADYLILEANYDEQMLATGKYPVYLQDRIKGEKGHLSNKQTADFIKENFTEKWKKIFLCHLSNENNSPEKAVETIKEEIKEHLHKQNEIEIIPLERKTASQLYILE